MPARKARRQGKNKTGRYQVSAKSERTVSGIVFDSKWEARVYSLLRKAVDKKHLHLQPRFLLQSKFKAPDGKAIREIVYIGDFLIGAPRKDYAASLNLHDIVVDAKGHETDIFKLKCKIFTYKYNTLIHRVKNLKDVQAVVDLYKELYS